MLGYFVAIAAFLLLGRWILHTRRRSAAAARAAAIPDNRIEPGTLPTVALLTGPSFDDDANEGDDPQTMGEPLARAIHDALRAHGFSPEEPYYSGSHGYNVDVPLAETRYTVSCGLYDGTEDEDANEWLVFLYAPGTRESDGRQNSAENSANARKLVRALHASFTMMPGVIRVRWQTDEAFERLREDWQTEPF